MTLNTTASCDEYEVILSLNSAKDKLCNILRYLLIFTSILCLSTIHVLLSSKNKDVNSQIIITTHSSHILNSKIHSNNTFNNICYLYEDKRNAAVANLNNKIVMPNEHEDEESEAFKFLKKHIKYKVSELFFSDAAIFVEGFAEDMIIPYYIEKMEGLRKHYISIFNINGAHGFLYKRLIEALGIPVLIITDLDIKRNEESDEADKQEGKKAKTYEQISCLADKETTNANTPVFPAYQKHFLTDWIALLFPSAKHLDLLAFSMTKNLDKRHPDAQQIISYF